MRNSMDSNNSQFNKIINRLVKDFDRQNITYSQSQYIIKQVRNQLGLKPTKLNRGTVKRMSRAELDRFLEAAYTQSSTIGLMMQTLYETAARVDEFVNLNADDIKKEELRIVIRSGKGNKRREVPIDRPLTNTLLVHLQDRRTGPIFRSRRSSRFSVRRIQQIVKNIAHLAEINSIEVTPHTLRHTRATLLTEQGMSTESVRDFLGHESVNTTEIYNRTANVGMDREFRKAVEG